MEYYCQSDFTTVEQIPVGHVFCVIIRENEVLNSWYYLKTRSEGVGYHCVNLMTFTVEELDGWVPVRDTGELEW